MSRVWKQYNQGQVQASDDDRGNHTRIDLLRKNSALEIYVPVGAAKQCKKIYQALGRSTCFRLGFRVFWY